MYKLLRTFGDYQNTPFSRVFRVCVRLLSEVSYIFFCFAMSRFCPVFCPVFVAGRDGLVTARKFGCLIIHCGGSSAFIMTTLNDFASTFAGRTALITGAASGIGAACAKLLSDRGAAKLILVDVDAEGLAALDLTCEVEGVIGSVADEALWDGLEPKLTGLHHAVVNAGIGGFGAVADLSFAEWRRVMDVNLDGAFLTLRAALRAIKANGKDTGGSAVITGSSTGVKPVPMIGPYGPAKAAVAHMARIAAMENAGANIRVNTIAPGGVDTAIWEGGDDFKASVEAIGRDETIKRMSKTTPNGRFASSEEIADTILYLLSDAGSNITGHVLVSDGGFTL